MARLPWDGWSGPREAAPQVERRVGTVRGPSTPPALHRTLRREPLHAEEALDGFAQPEIPGRQYIRSPEVEQEVHLGGPAAHTVQPGELGQHLLVGAGRELVQPKASLQDVPGEGLEVSNLLGGESRRAQRRLRRIAEPSGRWEHPGAARGAYPVQDGVAGRPADLLVDDGARERAEPRRGRGGRSRTDPVDHRSEERIGPAQVLGYPRGIVRHRARPPSPPEG